MLNLNKMEEALTRPSPVTSPNYITLLGLVIKNEIGHNAYNNYINDPMIASCINYNSGYQRFFINRYFLYLLSRYTFITNVATLNEVYLLVNDGELDAWFGIIQGIIVPFLKNNFVFEKVYAVHTEDSLNS